MKTTMKVLGTKHTIPMGLMMEHKKQAYTNHGQSLDHLDERGGVSAAEAVAIIEDRKFSNIDPSVAQSILERHITDWYAANPMGAAPVPDEKGIQGMAKRLANFYAAPPPRLDILTTVLIGTGAALDDAGEALGMSRIAQESDQDYRKRLIVVTGAPPSPALAADPVVEANRRMLLERSQLGIKKYGVTLGDAKLSERELVVHSLQEALDLANYLQANLMRIDAECALKDRVLQHIEAQAQSIANEFGERDPDTGAVELHGHAQDHWNIFIELAQEIREMK